VDGRDPDLLRFGLFELDLRSGELRREGSLLRLQGQPIELLAVLAGKAGEVVTREEIQRRIWRSETHVDFDQGINTCIRQIRSALGDVAENPRFIQTLPRRGYRFLASVTPVHLAGREPADAAPHEPPRAAALPSSESKRALSRTVVSTMGMALLAVTALTLLAWKRGSGETAAPQAARPVVAVLPYRNLSGDPNQDYVCDGFTEELITQLSRRYGRHLGVIARTSVMTYKDGAAGVKEIAAALGADYVVEGSLRREGDRVRVTSQLIRASDATHLWAGNHDRRLGDLLKLQGEVSGLIAGALAVQILPGEATERAATTAEAYDAYLKGKAIFAEGTLDAAKRSIEALERSVALDPAFAPAWAALAHVQRVTAFPRDRTADTGMEALRKALALDDDLPEAHAEMADKLFYFDWDFEGARAEWERALELDPGSASIRHDLAAYWGASGRHAEALRLVGEALKLDPLAPDVLSDVGWYSYFARRYDDAIERSVQTLRTSPHFFYAERCITLASMMRGDPARAIPTVREQMVSRRADPNDLRLLDDPDPAAALRAYWRWDREIQGRRVSKGWGSPSDVAVARLALGDREGALDALEEAVEGRNGWILPFLGVDPLFDAVRAEPRFRKIIERIGIVPAAS